MISSFVLLKWQVWVFKASYYKAFCCKYQATPSFYFIHTWYWYEKWTLVSLVCNYFLATVIITPSLLFLLCNLWQIVWNGMVRIRYVMWDNLVTKYFAIILYSKDETEILKYLNFYTEICMGFHGSHVKKNILKWNLI